MTAHRMHFNDATNGMRDAIRHAADPELALWAPYVGNRIDVAVWWARRVMRMARTLGYPTTAELEAELTEGDDADGEAFRGGEAREYEREQQIDTYLHLK